ncbi:MAG: acetate--CoA ligase family protein [Bacteroidota bacterium]
MKNNSNLDPLFKPKAVALIGASTKELSIGNVIIKNLVRYGYKGPIYPINPKTDEVRGIKAYKTIFDVPGDIDLAHIVIPPPFVPQAVEDCGKKGIKALIINTAGFKEMGSEGEALEKDFVARAKKYGIRIVGPNCQGIINTDPDTKAYCNFTFTFPEPGYVSIVAQSGGVGAIIMQAIYDMGIGMRMYASNGNACDVSIPEVIRYWGDDDETRVIILYLESLDDTREFMEAAEEVTKKKPIIAMRGGRTEVGAKASASHTGGLAGNIAIDLIFKKTGILSFTDEEALCQAAMAFATQPIPRGNRVGMITNTGGPAIIATDELTNAGLVIPNLSDNAREVLKGTMFSSASINNPLDVVATAGAPQFRSALDVMMDEEQIDSLYVNFVTPPFVDCDLVAEEFAEVNKQKRKPIVCNYITDKPQWTNTTEILQKGGIPCYNYPGTAARALGALTQYNELRSREIGEVIKFDDVDKDKAGNILQNVKEIKREVLSASEVYGILSAYGIPVADWRIVNNAGEAEKAASEIGFPVVVKADSEAIDHKSDMEGVAVNLKNTDDVRSVVEDMGKRLGTEGEPKFFIQKFLPGGRELVIGAKEEGDLGHLIMFGIGGIYIEILKDVIFNISPVTTVEAREMLTSIKAAALLKGARGEKGVYEEGVIEVILRVSQLVTELPMIREMDLNPVIAYEDKVVVVDARIRV